MPKPAPSSQFALALFACAPLALFGVAGAQAPPPAAVSPQEHRFAREDVLGTSLTLIVEAPDAEAAHRVETAVVAEIERLAAILSGHDEHSELRQLLAAAQAQPATSKASAELREVLAACSRWHAASHGAFHPGVGTAIERWRTAAKAGKPPADAELAELAKQLKSLPWQVDDSAGTVTMQAGASLSLDALAKGYIVDHAAKVSLDDGKCRVVLLAIGGDLRVMTATPRPVAVTDPRKPADNATPLATLQLAGRAVASSGDYKRGFDIGKQHFSHIVDPRTARPVEAVQGATVVADDCATADALATIVNVLPPSEGLKLIAQTAHAEAVIVDRAGKVHESAGWKKLTAPVATEAAASASDEVHIDFEINQPNAAGRGGRRRGGGYKRPYVAVWIEAGDGKPVRTLCLWIERDRWLPDLQRWYRLNKSNGNLVDAVSQATRKPGKYHLTWDGKDDAGKLVAHGTLTLCIEAAREHGTYQIMRQAFAHNGKPFTHEIAGNIEIKSATVTFGKKAQ